MKLIAPAVGLHSQSLIGKRVSQIREPGNVDLPACIARLIDDCCQQNPADRIHDMPNLIERLKLAETILEKQDSREISIDEQVTVGCRESSLDDTLSDTLAQDFGIIQEDGSVDLVVEDDSIDVDNPKPDA